MNKGNDWHNDQLAELYVHNVDKFAEQNSIDTTHINQVYFKILGWIIKNMESDKIKTGNLVLCDFDPDKKMFVLQDVTESLILESNNEGKNKESVYQYECDKDGALRYKPILAAEISLKL